MTMMVMVAVMRMTGMRVGMEVGKSEGGSDGVISRVWATMMRARHDQQGSDC